jgi:hypothetical protein
MHNITMKEISTRGIDKKIKIFNKMTHQQAQRDI